MSKLSSQAGCCCSSLVTRLQVKCYGAGLLSITWLFGVIRGRLLRRGAPLNSGGLICRTIGQFLLLT